MSTSKILNLAGAECIVKNCGCSCHIGDDLPAPEVRWYCVIVGKKPGVCQGRDRALELTRHVSGAVYHYTEREEVAHQDFSRALEQGGVVKVITSIRVTLTRGDLPGIHGFRQGDFCYEFELDNPAGSIPEAVVIVTIGRFPGVYQASTNIGQNVTGIKGSRVIPHKSRNQAVKDFFERLDSGRVVMVKPEQRIAL